MDAIYKRRSIRKFKEEPIADSQLTQIVRAGMAAPSCKSSFEWVFIIMKDPSRFKKVLEVNPYASALNTAAAAIVVCADLRLEKEPGEGWWIQDCSAAMENMLIEATDMGIGSVWLGVHPRKDRIDFVKELCQLPEPVEPLGMVALGFYERKKEPINRYLDKQVFHETYDQPWKP